MKARIIEIEREEIAPGLFRRIMWSNVPVDQLTYEDTREFSNRLINCGRSVKSSQHY